MTFSGLQIEPEPLDLFFIILNYVTCIPVLLCVGIFSLYHFHCLLGNSTTIEGWEKDKVAMLVRRGEIREIKFPYNLGRIKNVKAVLGPNPLLWCLPTVPPGDGLSYEIVQDGEYNGQWPPEDPSTGMDENHVFTLPKEPWTYGNGSFNPDLHPGSSNDGLRERRGYPSKGGGAEETSAVPPYDPGHDESHSSYEHLSRPPYADDDEEDDQHYAGRPQGRQFIRRGSEGYEVRPIDREEMMRQYVGSQSHLAAFARAQERAGVGEEDDNYGVSDEEGGESYDRIMDEKEMEREVRERMGEPGRYRPYVPERSESEDEDTDEPQHIPNGSPAQGLH